MFSFRISLCSASTSSPLFRASYLTWSSFNAVKSDHLNPAADQLREERSETSQAAASPRKPNGLHRLKQPRVPIPHHATHTVLCGVVELSQLCGVMCLLKKNETKKTPLLLACKAPPQRRIAVSVYQKRSVRLQTAVCIHHHKDMAFLHKW